MPKYVFDFDTMKKMSDSLRDRAKDLRKDLNSSKGNVNSELSDWKGASSEEIDKRNETSYKVLNEDVDTIEVMADYIDEAAKVIEAAEESLSSLEI